MQRVRRKGIKVYKQKSRDREEQWKVWIYTNSPKVERTDIDDVLTGGLPYHVVAMSDHVFKYDHNLQSHSYITTWSHQGCSESMYKHKS